MPVIRFRAVLELVEVLKSSAKYRLTYWGGSYEYMEMLHSNCRGNRDKTTGRKEIHVSHKPNYQSKDKSRPEMNLELKSSRNLSGLRNFLEFGKLTGLAYGEPIFEQTLKNGKENYFYPYRQDGFLFVCTPNLSDITDVHPTKIEWIVLKGSNEKPIRQRACKYIKPFREGGFNEQLESIQLRKYVDEDFPNV
ncbi:MAG: hypothetical protein Q4C37_02225 [Bacteroidales bacterium]|nr:hypothetical protein [Bacteroidales bacterium]